MEELAAGQVHITDAFWRPRLAMNAQGALLHQWEQLERSGCLHNFRLVAEGVEGFREGRYFADSDAYKWLDAACRALAGHPSEALRQRIDALIRLIGTAQEEDGYLFTYNQFHFPGDRWRNLQIEHELYCHGHLIEAAVSHYEATGQDDLLEIARKAADLLVRVFAGSGPEGTPGHQEIELALVKLYRVTGENGYLDLAEQFVEQRGHIRPFAPLIFSQNMSVNRRYAAVERQREKYLAQHPGEGAFRLPPDNVFGKPPGAERRFYASALSGHYFQQHRPVRQQTVPVGHAVRFAYLETAMAMLHQERGDASLLPALEQAWDHMVARRMYVTGGLGVQPILEGFGRDYELDLETAYAETCAALGCLFWNWEMALITREAPYADLFEWQLYNAASVGMGWDGTSYFYNNPLACRGGISRQPWFHVPCCPSNLSRTWAHLGRYLYSHEGDQLWVHQYVGSAAELNVRIPTRIEVDSGLPWQGRVRLRLQPESPTAFALHLRIPSWAGGYRLRINGEPQGPPPPPEAMAGTLEATASGYDPRSATYLPLRRTWAPGDLVELDLSMPLRARRPHPKVKGYQDKVALTRGPTVYCLESVDNPGLDIFGSQVELSIIEAQPGTDSLDGQWVLAGRTREGVSVTAIPYAAWGNRGESQMTVMVGV